MTIDGIITHILSAVAGLGLGTFINSWMTHRWEARNEGSKAIGEIVGRLIGIVGAAKDQISENERILAQVKRGDIKEGVANELLNDGQVDIGQMIMSARILCEAVYVDVQPLVRALEEYRLSAIETMRRQKEFLGSESPEVAGESFVMKVDLAKKERDLVNETVALIQSLKRAKF